MPTCTGGTLACDISGLCLSVTCPTGWTWVSATCRCDWPTHAVPWQGSCSCPHCQRVPTANRDCFPTNCFGHTNSSVCPAGWSPYNFTTDPDAGNAGGNFSYHAPDCTCAFINGAYCFDGGGIYCCPPNPTQKPWPTDCGVCPGGTTWDPLLGYCTHGPCPSGQHWCQVSGVCLTAPDPPCKDARACAWNEGTCVWDCTTPACPAGQTWSMATCSCQSGPPGIDLLEADSGWVFRSYQDGTGNVIVERTRDAGVTWE